MVFNSSISKDRQIDGEILKKLHLDLDSWNGNEKKELCSMLFECSSFLKSMNIDPTGDLLIAYSKRFLDKVSAVEEEGSLEGKIAISKNVTRQYEKLFETMQRNFKSREKAMDSLKPTNSTLASPEANITECQPTLPEEIMELLNVIEEQDQKIKELRAMKRIFSP